MKASCLLPLTLSVVAVTLVGCGVESAPRVTTQEAGAAKERVIKLNEDHQQRLEKLTLPGQN